MRTIQDMSLFNGLGLLTNEKMKVLDGLYNMSLSVFKFLHANKGILPELLRNSVKSSQWTKEIDEQKAFLEKEFHELYNSVSKIIISPLEFGPLYKQSIFLRKRYQNLESFLLTPNIIKELKIILQLLKDESDESFKKREAVSKKTGVNIVAVIEGLLISHDQLLNLYKDFIDSLAAACIASLMRYLHQEMEKHDIVLGEENLQKILKQIPDKKLMTEFKLAATTLDILKGWKILVDRFNNTERLANVIDQSLKEHATIKRLSYLRQDLDHASFFIDGYCALDINDWIKEDGETLTLLNQKKQTSSEVLKIRDLHSETISCRYTDKFLKHPSESDSPYLLGPLFCSSTNSELTAEDIKQICAKLISDLEEIFKAEEMTAAKISIGSRTSKVGHALGIKKRTRNEGFIFRDTNQGVFLFKDLKSLELWLPYYIENMNYQTLLKDYFIRKISSIPFLPSDSFSYQLSNRSLRRVANPMNEKMEDLDHFISKNLSRDSLSDLDILLLSAISFEKQLLLLPEVFDKKLFLMIEGKTYKQTASSLINFYQNFDIGFFWESHLSYEASADILSRKYKLPQEAGRFVAVRAICELLANICGKIDIKLVDRIRYILLTIKPILHPSSLATFKELDTILSKRENNEEELQNWVMRNLTTLLLIELRFFQFQIAYTNCLSKEIDMVLAPKNPLPMLPLYTGLPRKTCDIIIDYLAPTEYQRP